MTPASGDTPEPPRDCALCPRLVQYRRDNTRSHPQWWNAPVASFGDASARLAIVGLAPGVQGANRTGRPFTGDFAGDLLYATLDRFGLSRGAYGAHAGDGLELADALITNAVRCVPPENKPTGQEIIACRSFLTARLRAMPRVSAILALGRIAHDSVVRALDQRPSAHRFTHGGEHALFLGGRPVMLFDSYHCSRYNTNTGKLTREMFEAVFARIARHLALD